MHRGGTRNRIVAAGLAAGLLLATGSSVATAAGAGHVRVTKGQVTAAFQARTTGGYLNMLDGRTVAAPVRGLLNGRISPFSDGTYCDADWHYLAVTLLGQGGHGPAAAYLRATAVTFAIDGIPVSPLIQTAIKPFVGPNTGGQWGISTGRMLRPGAIADGDHVLETTIATPDGVEALSVMVELTPDAC